MKKALKITKTKELNIQFDTNNTSLAFCYSIFFFFFCREIVVVGGFLQDFVSCWCYMRTRKQSRGSFECYFD